MSVRHSIRKQRDGPTVQPIKILDHTSHDRQRQQCQENSVLRSSLRYSLARYHYCVPFLILRAEDDHPAFDFLAALGPSALLYYQNTVVDPFVARKLGTDGKISGRVTRCAVAG